MKCLYIITNSELGGAQVHLNDLITHLPQNIHIEVVVGSQGWLWDELLKSKIKCYYMPTLVRQISPISDLITIYKLRKIVVSVNPDIIHCHSSKAGFIGRIVGRICGIPVIFTAHGWSFTEGISDKKRRLYKLLEQMISRWSTKIICVSNYDRLLGISAMSKFANKFITVHNGIPDIMYSNNNKTNFNAPLNLIMVARFNEQKDHSLLLKAISMLKMEGIKFNTTLVGDGPLLNQTKKLADDLGISDEVHFLGARMDVEKLLKKQDVFLLISKWEGFPISILEAMRAGLPIIASDVGGVTEAVIQDETGFVIPRGDLKALVARMRQFHMKRQMCQQLGVNGRNHFYQFFTIDKMVEKIVEIYMETTGDVNCEY